MKNFILLVLLLVFIAAIVWYKYFREQEKPKGPKQPVKATPTKVEPKPAPVQPVAPKLPVKPKPAIPQVVEDDTAKIAKLKEVYNTQRGEYTKLKEQRDVCQRALGLLASKPGAVDIMPGQQKRVQTAMAEVGALTTKIKARLEDLKNKERQVNKERGMLRRHKSKSEMQHWYYVDTPGQKYPYSRYKKRNRKKAVKIVYGDDKRGEKAAAQVQAECNAIRAECAVLKNDLAKARVEYQNAVKAYRVAVKAEYDKLGDGMAKCKDAGMAAKREMEALEKKEGK